MQQRTSEARYQRLHSCSTAQNCLVPGKRVGQWHPLQCHWSASRNAVEGRAKKRSSVVRAEHEWLESVLQAANVPPESQVGSRKFNTRAVRVSIFGSAFLSQRANHSRMRWVTLVWGYSLSPPAALSALPTGLAAGGWDLVVFCLLCQSDTIHVNNLLF